MCKSNVVHTQVFEQASSNSATSLAHFCRAFPSSLMPSRISFLSKQAKKRSRPSQQRARLVRSGAMRPPSEDLFFESPDDQGSQPILKIICEEKRGRVVRVIGLPSRVETEGGVWRLQKVFAVSGSDLRQDLLIQAGDRHLRNPFHFLHTSPYTAYIFLSPKNGHHLPSFDFRKLHCMRY